jgi:hypothetical protein
MISFWAWPGAKTAKWLGDWEVMVEEKRWDRRRRRESIEFRDRNGKKRSGSKKALKGSYEAAISPQGSPSVHQDPHNALVSMDHIT